MKEKEREKEKERDKEQHRREEKEKSYREEVKHKSEDRDRGKDDRKRKYKESSQDRYMSSVLLTVYQDVSDQNASVPIHSLVNYFIVLSLCKHTCLFFLSLLNREKPQEKEARRPPAPPSWLQRDLKVRFIDKAFKGGRYYNSKVLIYSAKLYLLLSNC